MPSSNLVDNFTDRSLAPGEDRNDLWHITDLLIEERAEKHPDATANEGVVARILCWIVVAKPSEYVAAMREFRLLFKGISESEELRSSLLKSIRPILKDIEKPEDVIFQPDLYFEPPLGSELSNWF